MTLLESSQSVAFYLKCRFISATLKFLAASRWAAHSTPPTAGPLAANFTPLGRQLHTSYYILCIIIYIQRRYKIFDHFFCLVKGNFPGKRVFLEGLLFYKMGLGLFWGKCLNDFFKEIYVFIVIFIT
jgi:hypothetical protein